MTKSGIPGMAVAVVHGGKTVYAKGFGVKDVRTTTARTSRPRHGVPAGVAVQAAERRRWWPIRSARTRSAGTPRSSSKLPWFALSDPVVTQMVTRRRHVLAPLRAARPRRRPARGPRLRPAVRARAAAPAAARPVPNLLRLHQLRAHRRCRGRRGRARASRGRTSPRRCCSGRSAWRRRATGSPTTRPGRTAPSATSTSTDGYEPLYVRDARCRRRRPAGRSSSVNDMTRWLAMVLANGSHDGKQIVDAEGAAARADPADRVEPGDRARDAVGLLRVRIQRRHRPRRRGCSSAIPAPSNSARAPTS